MVGFASQLKDPQQLLNRRLVGAGACLDVYRREKSLAMLG